MFRDVAVFKNKHRLGAEQINIGDGNFFDGIVVKKVPFNTDANVYITEKGKGKLWSLDDKSPAFTRTKKDLEERLKKGELKAVQVYDTDVKPVKGLLGDSRRVHYIVSDNVETKPLAWGEQIPRRGGGHWEYEYDHYISQARMRLENINGKFKAWYEGDTTIMPISIRAMGAKVATNLDETRKLILAGDKVGAEAYVEKNLAAIGWPKVKTWFEDRVVNGVNEGPFLSLKEPIRVRARDQSILDIDKSMPDRYKGSFRDGTRDPHNPSRQMSVKFTGERDERLYTLNDKGTKNNPIFEWEPATLADPLPMMNRAMSRMNL